MSQKLVSLNSDLYRLRVDGYDLRVTKSNHLFLRDVPYVTAAKEIKRGIIASVLDLAGDLTVPPEMHVVYFVGEPPCDEHGNMLPGVSVNTNQALGAGMDPNHQISRKPTVGPNPGKYKDYYEKMVTYAAIVSGPAQVIDSRVTARTYPIVIPEAEDASVFHYLDTASTKAGIVAANGKLEGKKVAIIGVGGTGAYVLDFAAKTHVREIHLFDGDAFLNHNAFRCPGAPSLADLNKKQQKVAYLAALYSNARTGVIAHDCFVDDSSIEQLKGMDFVFICIDRGVGKATIVAHLEDWGIPFIDVGMGIQLGDENTVGGVITVTANTPAKRDHFRKRVAFSDGAAENEYSQNVQIAELNALNAALAVIKWKKLCGYYDDTIQEFWSAYTIRTNQLISEDRNEA